jgi:alpha-D-xyloside xylohydrolase
MEKWRLDEQTGACAVFAAGEERLRVEAVADCCLRVTCSRGKPFVLRNAPMIADAAPKGTLTVSSGANGFTAGAAGISACLNADTGALAYYDGDYLLTREPDSDGRLLRPVEILRYAYDSKAPLVERMTADGAKISASGALYADRHGFQTRLSFVFSPDEDLYGLGQHEEGILNYRGQHQYLYQHNLKVSCPVLFSSRGWALLYNSCSAQTFHDDAFGSYMAGDADDEMDFFIIRGPSFDRMIGCLRALCGDAPLPPKWAFGYVQSKEHYHTQEELLSVAREYRRRQIPLDVIVQDWLTWEEGLWGQKTADPARYPDIPAAARTLGEMHVRLMWSIWPNMGGNGADREAFDRRGLLLGNRSTYNAFLQEGRALYWEQAKGLFQKGVAAWWCDCSEPFEADWYGAVPMTPEDRMRHDVDEFKKYLDPTMANAYSIYHSQGIYEGQRAVTNDKRVLNLTRSGFPGQQRYGTFTWNGDTSARWDVLARSLPDGLNFCLSGQPYWTMDVGGFFVKRWEQWFGRGGYENGCLDPGYRELYLRWFQLATFLPMLRSHGTDTPREVWRFGEEGELFYEAIVKMIRLRMRLIPYLYSLAGAVTFSRETMLRMLAFDFPGDKTARNVKDEFMLGRALLICPVLKPGAAARQVYLPADADWYDLWTEMKVAGGQWIRADAPLPVIPVFVRAGSVLPLGPVTQYADEPGQGPLTLNIYPGADGAFSLYNDAGDGYGYEQGERAFTRLKWDNGRQALTRADEGDARFIPKDIHYRIIGGDGHEQSTGTI